MLDTGPLGLVTNPKLSSESTACAQWLQAHIAAGNRIIIPEIADYVRHLAKFVAAKLW